MVLWTNLWTGVAQLVVAGLLLAAANHSRSVRIKTFLYIGMAILVVLAGYQLIAAFN